MTYEKYLSNIKRRKRIIILNQLLILIIFIITWQFLANKNYINTFITSSPKNILLTLTANLIKILI